MERGLAAHAVAKQLGVPYTTAVQWVQAYREHGEASLEARKPALHPNLKKPPDERAKAILATQAQTPGGGSRRIRDVMRRFLGIGVSATTVRRVLKAEGIKPQAARRRMRREPVVQHFERAEPNQLWQSDLFTFLLRRHERLYVAAFLDDHSRYLVSLAIAHHQRSVLVLEALSRGIAEYGSPREILTDQGRQYTAWRGSTEFEAELKRHGIQHVKSRPHHPQTCGKIERFWKTLWEELLSRTVFADFEDCQRRVNLFIQHYNFHRPHQALAGLAPADRFFRAAPAVRAAIEAQVAENALRLAREQPLVKPFYLAGQLGDQALAISASAAALSVRVGDEHTTIPFGKESEDEYHGRASRFGAGRGSQEGGAPEPPAGVLAKVAAEPGRRAGDRARPMPDDPRRVVGPEDGPGGDRGAEDLPRAVLPAGVEGAQGDGAGAEPGHERGGERSAGAEARTGAHPGSHGADEAADAAQEKSGAPCAPGREIEPGEREHGPSWPTTQGAVAVDDAWRRLALIWERKLCGESVASGLDQEVSDERGTIQRASSQRASAFHLHAESRGAAGTSAASGSDPRGAVGGEVGERGGARDEPVAQPLPVDPASLAGGDDRGACAEGSWSPREAPSDERAGTACETARAAEHAPEEAGRGDP
jgi:transposase InsO family protein